MSSAGWTVDGPIVTGTLLRQSTGEPGDPYGVVPVRNGKVHGTAMVIEAAHSRKLNAFIGEPSPILYRQVITQAVPESDLAQALGRVTRGLRPGRLSLEILGSVNGGWPPYPGIGSLSVTFTRHTPRTANGSYIDGSGTLSARFERRTRASLEFAIEAYQRHVGAALWTQRSEGRTVDLLAWVEADLRDNLAEVARLQQLKEHLVSEIVDGKERTNLRR